WRHFKTDRGIMDTEILNATHEGMFPSQLMMIEAIALITIIFAIAGVAICLAGITWLCFEEGRRTARRRMKPTQQPPEPDEYDLLAVLTALDEDLSDNSVDGVARRTPDVTQASAGSQPENALACGSCTPLNTMLQKSSGEYRNKIYFPS